MNTLKKKIIIASLFVLSSIFGSMYVNYHQQKVQNFHRTQKGKKKGTRYVLLF